MAFTLPLLSSCHNSVDPDYSNISDPYARWQAYNLSSYSIEERKACFCSVGGVLVRLSVRNDSIVGVTDAATGTSLPYDRWSGFKTVNGLFQIIRSIHVDSVARFTVSYDAKYGFPTSFFVDPSEKAVDEEFGYDCSHFVRHD